MNRRWHQKFSGADRSVLLCRLMLLSFFIIALLSLAVYWSAGPVDLMRLLARLQAQAQSAGLVIVVATCMLALTLAVPLGLLALLVIAALGPWNGFFGVLVSALLSIIISHSIGHLLGHQVVVRLAWPRVRLLSQYLGRRGLRVVIMLRMLPLAPFAVVNMVAGATHIRLRDMLLGSAIGMSPGILALAFFMDWILAQIQQPERNSDLWLGGVLLLIILLVLVTAGVRRWLLQRLQSPCAGSDAG